VSSLDRMLQLLDVFTPSRATRSTEQLIKLGGSSRSTTYRYIRALQRAGLLSPVANGSWTLGSRILELDLQLRTHDPLYIAGGPVMQRLVERTGHTALLCTLYSDAVICIRDERSLQAPGGLFSRGQRRPLFKAAASKILLPYLPAHQLRRVYNNNKTAIAAANLGHDWKSFLAELREMRSKGYCVTIGEFRPGIVGIAAPVLSRSGNALASIGLAFPKRKLKTRQVDTLVALVREAAATLSKRIRRSEWALDLPARRIGRIRE
jgi:DNA-binding IclR family transcriptional regulator